MINGLGLNVRVEGRCVIGYFLDVLGNYVVYQRDEKGAFTRLFDDGTEEAARAHVRDRQSADSAHVPYVVTPSGLAFGGQTIRFPGEIRECAAYEDGFIILYQGKDHYIMDNVTGLDASGRTLWMIGDIIRFPHGHRETYTLLSRPSETTFLVRSFSGVTFTVDRATGRIISHIETK